MATYEGKWRCLRCSEVNLGRNLNCQSCGVKRDENVEFFLEDDAPELTDEIRLREANAGADWICQFCGGNNRALDAQCSSCGNRRSDGDRQLIEETRGVHDWTEAAQQAARQNAAHNVQPPHTVAAPKSFFSNPFVKLGALLLGLFGTAFIGLIALLFYLSTVTTAVDLRVTGLEWERRIALEEYKTVTETAWEGELPPNARLQSKERAVHHYDQVPTGTRTVPETYSEEVSDGSERYVCGKINKKNGYFEDKYCTRTKYKTVTKTRSRQETIFTSVPDYRNRYTYQIEKWTDAGDQTTSGTDFNPHWADVQIDNKRWRERGRSEKYELLCSEIGGKNRALKFKVKPETWSNFHTEMRLRGTLDFFGDLISID